jgi:hypothetical protein
MYVLSKRYFYNFFQNYRKFFNLTDNTDIPTLVRNRLKLEISCKVEKEDVRFRLMFSLNGIFINFTLKFSLFRY